MSVGLYRVATVLAGPVVRVILAVRRRRGKEHATRFRERLGYSGLARPVGRLIWFHAASIGESVSLLPVLSRIRSDYPDVAVLVTSGTVTSAAILSSRCPPGTLHQFVPVDVPGAVRRFLDHWRPDAAVWVESELWPNLVLQTAQRGVPMALINGRLSEKAARGWRRWPGLACRIGNAFRVCLAQSDRDAKHFRSVGFSAVETAGNLKLAAPPPPVDAEAALRLRGDVGDRPVWIALSIHPGEDEAVAEAHQAVQSSVPNALCIAVPRHPERADGMRATFEARGLNVARRSRNEVLGSADVLLADTMGELGTLMSVAVVAFVGKSLGVHGGQNPIEPAKAGLAVLFGPNMENFASLSEAMLEAGAAQCVTSADDLGRAVIKHLSDPSGAGRDAALFMDQGAAVLSRTVDVVTGLLERSDAGA